MNNAAISSADRLLGLSPEKLAYVRRLAAAAADRPAPEPSGAPGALSFGQERMWFLQQLDPQSAAYTLFHAVRLGAADIDMIEVALCHVVARHAVLRTRYVLVDGAPVPIVDDGVGVRIERFDLRSRPHPEDATSALARQLSGIAFDLANGPLLHAAAARVADDDWVLLLTCHHIVVDARSMTILVAELTEAYTAILTGRATHLTPIPIQYSDYSAWQRARLTGPHAATLATFWRDELRGASSLELPGDRPRPPVRTDRGGAVRVHVASGVVAALQSQAAEERASLYIMLLAAYGVLLHRWSGQDDFVVGTPVEGRTRSELEGLIGFFINTIPVRVRIDPNATFRTVLREVRTSVLRAFDHQELPIERVIQEVAPERRLDRTPLFQTTFQVQRRTGTLEHEHHRANTDPIAVPSQHSLFDLAVDLTDGPSGLVGRVEFSDDLFDRATIERFVGHFGRLLESIVAGFDEPIERLEIRTDAEISAIEARSPRTANITATVVELMKKADGAAPIRLGSAHVTADGLHQRARALASRLVAAGVRHGDIVGVLLDRSPEQITAQLATWLAGAAFLPLDPSHPEHRLRSTLEAAQVRHAITNAEHTLLLDTTRCSPVAVEDLPVRDATTGSVMSIVAGDLAYVIATSGTTGVPKIVEVEHGSLANHVTAMAATFGLVPEDIVLWLASPAFDVALEEVWPTLVSGAGLVIAESGASLDLNNLTRTIESGGVTVLNLPSPLWHEWLLGIERGDLHVPPSVRLVVIGSDRVDPTDLARWWRTPAPRPRLVQAYGITEATITSLVHEIREGTGPQEAPVIGHPIVNVGAHVRDPAGRDQPDGIPGELYISGAGVARGYRDAPFRDRCFATGDRVLRRTDGAIVFLGRMDEQLKVRGTRIEPAELAHHLCAHPGVRDAVVVLRAGMLVAFVVPADDPPSADDLREHMRSRVPQAVLPASYAIIPAMPLTPNGKVDRTALVAPATTTTKERPPRTTTELAVAAAWRELLGIVDISADANFFDLGAHSLLLIRAHLLLRSKFCADIEILDLFRHPNVRSLARHIDRLRQ